MSLMEPDKKGKFTPGLCACSSRLHVLHGHVVLHDAVILGQMYEKQDP